MSSVPPLVITPFPPITVQSAVLSSIPLPITSLPPVEPYLSSTVISSPSVVPTTPSGGGGLGSGGGVVSSSIVNSASLYLYTFLATIILLLSVAGMVAVRTYMLRRRNQRMIVLAIRNGTYVPPSPPARPVRVDLSKKPGLWEAYLGGGGGWQPGSGSGKKELDIGTSWKSEYSRDWQSIKPICAGYTEPLTSVPYSGSAPDVTGPTPRGDDEENRRTAEVSTGTTTTTTTTTTPSLLTRARIFFNPNSSTVPASSSADNGTNMNPRTNSANMSMTELISNSESPPKIKVAVLIAMPTPSSGGSHAFSNSTPPLSASRSPKSRRTTSHPFDLSSPSSSPTKLRFTDDEDQPLPHLEMGVAHVVVGRSEKSLTWGDSAHTATSRSGR